MGDKRHSQWLERLSPDQGVALFLALWWGLNLVVASFLELANDEAYYWFYSWHLDWGYYDHPPMVALLVKMGTWLFGGELGVRLFSTLLQPLYLYLFWTLVRPQKATLRDAGVYCLVCFAMPMLQLYGVLALPDAPLLFFTVVFLWAYKRFAERDSWLNAALMGASMALLMYSKYHGLLVIVFVLCSRWRNFRSPKLYLAVVLGILLYTPHLWWQYSHDFPSLRYHLVQRHDDDFTLKHLGDTFLNLLLVFNPFYLFHYGRGLAGQIRERCVTTYTWLVLGFVGFFTLSALKYSTQPQWMLPAVFGFIVLLMNESRRSEKAYRYIRTVGIAGGVFFLVVRVIILTVPLPGELWHNKCANQELADLANGRPVIFLDSYGASSKYAFYAGQPTYTQPIYFLRDSQWQYSDIDDDFLGKDVVVAVEKSPKTLAQCNGKTLSYVEVSSYCPVRKVKIWKEGPLRRFGEDHVETELHIYNPYPYPIYSTVDDTLQIVLTFRVVQRVQPCVSLPLTDTIAPGDTLTLRLQFPFKDTWFEDGKDYSYAFFLRHRKFTASDNSPRYRFKYKAPCHP